MSKLQRVVPQSGQPWAVESIPFGEEAEICGNTKKATVNVRKASTVAVNTGIRRVSDPAFHRTWHPIECRTLNKGHLRQKMNFKAICTSRAGPQVLWTWPKLPPFNVVSGPQKMGVLKAL